MINLLPPQVKDSIGYARRNTRLRNWCIALFVSMLVIGGIIGAGQVYLQRSITSYSVQVEEGNKQLEEQKLTETQARVTSIGNGLKLMVQVLSRQILFSKLLSQIGAALPNGSVLTDLSIDNIQGGLGLSAAAVDYQTATQVQVNLQDPKNQIFEKADILNIQCSETQPTIEGPYKCTVKVQALFSQNNPFLFITKGTTP